MEMKTRLIENDIYIPVLRELIEEGQQVRMTVSGSSMSPLICHHRDSVLLEAPKGPLKKGDIAFYQRDNGAYILHRICKVKKGEGIWCIGDNQTVIEGPLREDQVFALVTAICRKEQWIRPGSLTWNFFRYIWLNMIPLRRPAIGLYSLISRIKKTLV